MKNREYIMLLISLFILSILIFGIIYVIIRVDNLEKEFNNQSKINEYILNRIEAVSYE